MTTHPRIPALLFLAAATALHACNDDDTVEIHLNNGTTKAHIVAHSGPVTPTGPLSITEKKKLLKAIRKNPDRIRTLTNRERRWLAGAALAD
jgi:hypothetical protein